MDLKDKVVKYQAQVLSFKGYYKFSFMYSNDVIEVFAGGDSGDIYRADLKPEMTLGELAYECGTENMSIKELTNNT